jgi:hypothetical protein
VIDFIESAAILHIDANSSGVCVHPSASARVAQFRSAAQASIARLLNITGHAGKTARDHPHAKRESCFGRPATPEIFFKKIEFFFNPGWSPNRFRALARNRRL